MFLCDHTPNIKSMKKDSAHQSYSYPAFRDRIKGQVENYIYDDLGKLKPRSVITQASGEFDD